MTEELTGSQPPRQLRTASKPLQCRLHHCRDDLPGIPRPLTRALPNPTALNPKRFASHGPRNSESWYRDLHHLTRALPSGMHSTAWMMTLTTRNTSACVPETNRYQILRQPRCFVYEPPPPRLVFLGFPMCWLRIKVTRNMVQLPTCAVTLHRPYPSAVPGGIPTDSHKLLVSLTYSTTRTWSNLWTK